MGNLKALDSKKLGFLTELGLAPRSRGLWRYLDEAFVALTTHHPTTFTTNLQRTAERLEIMHHHIPRSPE